MISTGHIDTPLGNAAIPLWKNGMAKSNFYTRTVPARSLLQHTKLLAGDYLAARPYFDTGYRRYSVI